MIAALNIECPKCKVLAGRHCQLLGADDAITDHVHNDRVMLAAQRLVERPTPDHAEIVRLDGVVASLRKRINELDEHYGAMRACIVYARDRRGGAFDFDEWTKMVEYALRAGTVPMHALEDAQTRELQVQQVCSTLRKERDEWKRRATTDASSGAGGLWALLNDELRTRGRPALSEDEKALIEQLTCPSGTNEHAPAIGIGSEASDPGARVDSEASDPGAPKDDTEQ